MDKNEVARLAQLIGALKEGVDKLASVAENRDVAKFSQIKKELIAMCQGIDKIT